VTCPRTPSDLGAYVLGALSPEERRLFEEHLDGCALCTAELAEFADIPALLDRVRPEDLQPVAVTPSPELFDRVSAAAHATPERTSRSRQWLLIAAAVLALLGVGTGVIFWAVNRGSDTSDTVTASAGSVHATLAVTGQEEGTLLELTVDGLRPGETCRMVAVDDHGEWYTAGEWPVSANGDGTWRGWADVPRDELTEVVVYGDGDRELVRLQV
jgi:anti-sigma-K factor RskA